MNEIGQNTNRVSIWADDRAALESPQPHLCKTRKRAKPRKKIKTNHQAMIEL